MKFLRFYILLFIWALFGSAIMYGVTSSDDSFVIKEIIASVISFAPLLGLMLALGSVKAAAQFNNWTITNTNSIYYLTGIVTLLFVLPSFIIGNFNPYATVIFATTAMVVWGTLKNNREETFKLSFTDVALWMLLWIPFDLRWSMDLLPAVDSISYTWWSVAISVVAIIGWYGFRGADIGYNLVPKSKDLYLPILGVLFIMAMVVPPGLLTGFLTFAIPETFDIPKLTLHFVGLFLTVALPEELFFRGILLRGLDGRFSNKWIPMLISSVAFGLMHWNNVSELSSQLIYVSLATLGGVGYGWVYRKAGNGLLAAILTHTLIDWIWKLFFTG